MTPADDKRDLSSGWALAGIVLVGVVFVFVLEADPPAPFEGTVVDVGGLAGREEVLSAANAVV
jgi:hypothetical protein